MAFPRFRPRAGTFTLLLLMSAFSLFLPPEWSDSIKHVAQLLVPAQDMLRSAARRAAAPLQTADSSPHSQPDADALLRELASQNAYTAQLREENDRLRSLRERQLPPAIPLLDAKIVARDVALWRDSVLVARGSSRGVSRRDWVASRLFLNRGSASSVDEGQAVLARQCLIGTVDQVSPYMSRVELLSDVDSPRVEVRIAHVRNNRVQFIDYSCSLHGAGRGRMAIDNVESRYVQAGSSADADEKGTGIRVGDLVLTAPGQLGLPVPMTIGKITEIAENPHKRLVYNLTIQPLVDVGELRDVFVIPIVPPEPNSNP